MPVFFFSLKEKQLLMVNILGQKKSIMKNNILTQDFYFNDKGRMVFTKEYHLKRGYCCKSNFLNCAYRPEN